MSIQPLSDRIVLKALEKTSTTNSGIYIPEGANKERPYIYEVVEIGPGKSDSQITVKVGDKVLCGQYSGDEVTYEGQDYKIVAMEYILAIVK